MKRTHVLLDLDGTISHSEPGIFRSLQWACELEGFPTPTDAEVRRVIGPPLELVLPAIGSLLSHLPAKEGGPAQNEAAQANGLT